MTDTQGNRRIVVLLLAVCLVAGFRGDWRWFLDMAVVLHSNSTGPGLMTVE